MVFRRLLAVLAYIVGALLLAFVLMIYFTLGDCFDDRASCAAIYQARRITLLVLLAAEAVGSVALAVWTARRWLRRP